MNQQVIKDSAGNVVKELKTGQKFNMNIPRVPIFKIKSKDFSYNK